MGAESTSYQPPPNGWRTFLIIWGTQSASVFGSAMTLFAMNIWLTQTLYPRPDQKPQLAAALAAINLAFAIPVVFGAPLAGAWADRHDRKRTMMVADFCNGALSLVLATRVLSGSLQLWMLLVIIALMAFLSAFHGAAFDTSYAMLVTEERLPRANGLMQTMWALSGILAPAVAAALHRAARARTQRDADRPAERQSGIAFERRGFADPGGCGHVLPGRRHADLPVCPVARAHRSGGRGRAGEEERVGRHQDRRALHLAPAAAPVAVGYLRGRQSSSVARSESSSRCWSNSTWQQAGACSASSTRLRWRCWVP